MTASEITTQSDLHAAIDIGTNSMHLVVARADADGGFDLLTSEKEMVRLGSGGGDMKLLTPEAIDRGIAALHRMSKVAESFGAVDLAAVATSAVREARNGRDFIQRAKAEVGIDVEVISGFEEARLIHLGVLQALQVFDKRLLAVDIGGGSTELVVGQGMDILEARSMKLGAIRLTERFFPDGVVTVERVAECRAHVKAALAPVAWELRGHSPEVSVGSSGTIATLATMAAAKRGESVRQLNGLSFTSTELESVIDDILAADERRKLSGLDEKREDIILGGSLLLSEIFRSLGISSMMMSGFALREGVLLDRFGGSPGQGLERLKDLRKNNASRLARQLDPDPAHAEQTAKLALQLFDRTVSLHHLTDADRELLEAAALLHNVGLFISHSSHHKHSYYVIRNSEQLTGFTQAEVELIAVVARYHRKSLPTEKHEEFARLDASDQRRVRIMAGLLRIAIGLDRRHAGSVRLVRVVLDDAEIVIEPLPEPGEDLEVEVYAATERSVLLGLALERTIRVQLPRPVPTEALSS